jgi:dTDP-4-amino-4,6-dideoxygalactose transaminase
VNIKAKYHIPQANPGAVYKAYRVDFNEAVDRVLERGWYILGEEGKAFEEEFALWSGTTHGVGVASGTDALELALRALDIKAGDLVATVSHTAVATASAILRAGAVPLFVDILEDTFTMDPESLEKAFFSHKSQIRTVLPVHLYGHPVDMQAIMEVAGKFDVPIVEDCAQAHGATLGDRKAGTFGVMSAFSFYPTKNLGAFGDAGAVLTSDENLYRRLTALRQYGWEKRNESTLKGVNSRLDEVQAAILRVRLVHLADENHRRRSIAQRYDSGLAGTTLSLPVQRTGSTHVYHQYVVRHPQRDQLMQDLGEVGIGTAIHYPVPIHLQPAFSGSSIAQGGLPVTERVCREIFSLPIYAQLTDGEVDSIIEEITQWDDR